MEPPEPCAEPAAYGDTLHIHYSVRGLGGCGGEDTSIRTGGEGRKQIDRQEGVGSDRKVLAATNKKARGR